MQIGILGLGTMGGQIAAKLMQEGNQVVVWNQTRDILEQWRVEKAEFIVNQKLLITRSVDELSGSLIKPRVFWLMLPAGEETENAIQEIYKLAEAGDVIIDGGNSHYKDTQRRFEMFQQKGIRFLGIGVAGGVYGLENGFSLMAGGDQEGFSYITPALDNLAKPYGCYTYFGPGGVGHYIKMIHNAIECGMVQALGEGLGLVLKSDYQINLIDLARTWQQGSIIEGFLLQMVIEALSKDPELSQTEGYIGSTPTVKSAVEEAKEKHVPVTVIEHALHYRENSQIDKGIQESFTAKLIQAIRKEFGGYNEKPPVPTQ